MKFSGYFNDEWLEGNKEAFIPKIYVKAWLYATIGYWNVETTHWVTSDSGFRGEAGTSLLYEATGIEALDRNEADFESLRLHAPFYPLFNIAVSVWIVFFVAVFRIVSRDAKMLIPLIPLLALWATLMIAAPAHCQFRYMFAFHLAMPILLATLCIASAKLRGGKRNSMKNKVCR